MISVIIPSYNRRDLIGQTLDSVFAQTCRDIEVIVVDDGSTDGTEDALRPLAESRRIVYIRQDNAGQGAARTRGVEAAQGDFLAFLDDDDLWPPDKLEWQEAVLRVRPEVVLAYGDYARLRSDGSLSEPVETYCPSGRVRREFLRGCWMLSPGQALIRASAFRAAGGLDPEIRQSDDWDLYIRLAALGEFHHERRVALHYRFHAGNDSRNAVRHAENHLKVVRKHIGWNLPMNVMHRRQAARFFVPNLMRNAHESRQAGDYGQALRAYWYALQFDPTLAWQRSYLKGLAGTLLKRPPRTHGGTPA